LDSLSIPHALESMQEIRTLTHGGAPAAAARFIDNRNRRDRVCGVTPSRSFSSGSGSVSGSAFLLWFFDSDTQSEPNRYWGQLHRFCPLVVFDTDTDTDSDTDFEADGGRTPQKQVSGESSIHGEPITFFQFGIGIGIGIGIGFSHGLFRFNTRRRFDRSRRQYLRQFLPPVVFDTDSDTDPDPDLKLRVEASS
jgi:hypothetical protein